MRTANKNVSRLNESQLRRIIRSLIRETPMVDLPSGKPAYIRGPELTPSQRAELGDRIDDNASFGYERALEYTEEAKKIFSKREDNWAVILPPFSFTQEGSPSGNPEFDAELHSVAGLKNWAKELGIPEGTKIIVAGDGDAFGEAHNEIEWTLRHDIIGHHIDSSVCNIERTIDSCLREFYGSDYNSRLFDSYCVVELIHEFLPKGSKVAYTHSDDESADIAAAVFLKDISSVEFAKVIIEDISRRGVPGNSIKEFFHGRGPGEIEQITEHYREFLEKYIVSIMLKIESKIEEWASNFPVDDPQVHHTV